MDITLTNLREFEKLVKLCRKYGVLEASVNGMAIKLDNDETNFVPRVRKSNEQKLAETNENGTDDDKKYDEEDVLFWSTNPPSA